MPLHSGQLIKAMVLKVVVQTELWGPAIRVVVQIRPGIFRSIQTAIGVP